MSFNQQDVHTEKSWAMLEGLGFLWLCFKFDVGKYRRPLEENVTTVRWHAGEHLPGVTVSRSISRWKGTEQASECPLWIEIIFKFESDLCHTDTQGLLFQSSIKSVLRYISNSTKETLITDKHVIRFKEYLGLTHSRTSHHQEKLHLITGILKPTLYLHPSSSRLSSPSHFETNPNVLICVSILKALSLTKAPI